MNTNKVVLTRNVIWLNKFYEEYKNITAKNKIVIPHLEQDDSDDDDEEENQTNTQDIQTGTLMENYKGQEGEINMLNQEGNFVTPVRKSGWQHAMWNLNTSYNSTLPQESGHVALCMHFIEDYGPLLFVGAEEE